MWFKTEIGRLTGVSFFNNWKILPIISPLLIDDHFVTNANKKANHFNDSFANHCSLINSSNKLALNRASITTSFSSSVNIKESDILDILKSLDVNKAYGYDDSQLGC